MADRPVLYGSLAEVATAFNQLSMRRTVGMGINPIQFSEICAFIQLFGPPSLPIDVFIDLLAVMDKRYMELSNGDNSSS